MHYLHNYLLEIVICSLIFPFQCLVLPGPPGPAPKAEPSAEATHGGRQEGTERRISEHCRQGICCFLYSGIYFLFSFFLSIRIFITFSLSYKLGTYVDKTLAAFIVLSP